MSETATADSTAAQAREKAQDVGTQAKEKAQEAGAQARDRVRAEVDRRSTEAGEQAGSAAQALRQASDKLRQDGNEPVARGMEQVAQRVESAGGWLRESDGDTILREVEDFGRRKPLAVVAGGLALGFAASRLLKASSRSRYQESRGSYGGNGHATSPVATPGVPATAWSEGEAARGI
jgi:vacuolar-type H+-ATPase subunit E/Vma4